MYCLTAVVIILGSIHKFLMLDKTGKPGAAMLQKKNQHKAHPPVGGDSPFGEHKVDIRRGGHTNKKNEDQFNLYSCPPKADLPLARSFVVSWWLCV